MRMCTLICAGVLGGVFVSHGFPDFSDNFNLYNDGDLAGQGPWLQTGTIATTPIQINAGRAQLGTAGQDIYAAFGAPITSSDGTSLYVGLTINVTSAQAAGDYFFHLSNPAGTTTSFYNRLFARSLGGGFELGFLDISGIGSTITYGGVELSLATDHRVVIAQNFVAGALNDTFSLYVNPTDLAIEANNSPYLTHIWTSATAETATYAAANLRQGTAANAAALFVDDLVISSVFSDVAPVPEPHFAALFGGLGLLMWTYFRRNRR